MSCFDMIKFCECSLLENEHAREYMAKKEAMKNQPPKKKEIDLKAEATRLIDSYEPLYIEL